MPVLECRSRACGGPGGGSQVCRPGNSTRQGQGNAGVRAEEAGAAGRAAECRPWGDTLGQSEISRHQTSCNQKWIQCSIFTKVTYFRSLIEINLSLKFN